MPPPCPTCGGHHVIAVAEFYDTQVRTPDADPTALAPFAPPVRRSVFHGTACITAFFMALLSPGFVPDSRVLTVFATFAALGLVTLFTWLRSRKTDQLAMAAYQRRRICPECRWTA